MGFAGRVRVVLAVVVFLSGALGHLWFPFLSIADTKTRSSSKRCLDSRLVKGVMLWMNR